MEMFADKAKTGRTVLIIGMVAHFLSAQAFVGIVWFSHRQLRRGYSLTSNDFPWVMLWLLYFTSICVMVSIHFSLSTVQVLICI